MSLLLYGVTGEPTGAEDLRGIGGTRVQRIAGGSLVVMVSEHDQPPPLSEATLWEFEHVIESAMKSGPVLPVRFGTLLATAADVEQWLETRREELMAKLENVRGAVELSVRGVWPAEEPSAAAGADTGTEYMRARLAPQRRARELADRVHAQLDGFARASRHRILTRATVPVSAAFLIDQGTQEQFVNAVTGLDARLDDTELVCTGPWPPYSFVGDPIDA
ncbi:MAG TPA: GvpL/GvpF family gas vesicle protein [Solirubrobacteraceae bacterium]